MEILRTLSVAAFKALHGVDTMQVVESPKTGKLFVAAAGKTLAAVSKNYVSSEPKEFIECKFEEVAEPVWVLHNVNSTNVKEEL